MLAGQRIARIVGMQTMGLQIEAGGLAERLGQNGTTLSGGSTGLGAEAGGGLALHSFLRGRFPLFAMGSASVYVALSRWAVRVLDDDTLVFSWFLVTSVAAMVALVRAHRL